MQDTRVSATYIGAFIDFLINIAIVFFGLKLVEKFEAMAVGENVIIVCALLVFTASFVYFLSNAYSTKRYEKSVTIVLRFFVAQIFVLAISVLVVTIAPNTDPKYYIFSILSCFISFFLIAVKKVATRKIIHKIRSSKKNKKTILIVGNSQGAVEYSKQIENNAHFGYKVIGCVCDSKAPKLNKLGETSELETILRIYKPDEIVLAFHANEDSKLQKVLNICDKFGIRTSIVPVVYKYFQSKSQIDMIGNLPVVNTRAIPLDNMANAALKRIMDIVISLCMIILTMPIMIIAFIGVKLSSKGPAIFKQKRVGKNNKEFTMYKFRSMRVNDQETTGWTTAEDSRKTKFGTFMRKTGIDELPQFFNVLFGSMSIIGPRPELPIYVEKYRNEIPLYMVKHQVKPGITGLAQIYGYRGDTSIEKRIELDIQYIENWTLFNDIKILVATPFKMFNRNEKYVK